MGDTEGERLARLEVKVDQIVEAMKVHQDDHKMAIQEAKAAKDTAREAALLTAINQRSNKATLRAAWIGGGVVVAVQVAQFAMKLTGHG